MVNELQHWLDMRFYEQKIVSWDEVWFALKSIKNLILSMKVNNDTDLDVCICKCFRRLNENYRKEILFYSFSSGQLDVNPQSLSIVPSSGQPFLPSQGSCTEVSMM